MPPFNAITNCEASPRRAMGQCPSFSEVATAVYASRERRIHSHCSQRPFRKRGSVAKDWRVRDWWGWYMAKVGSKLPGCYPRDCHGNLGRLRCSCAGPTAVAASSVDRRRRRPRECLGALGCCGQAEPWRGCHAAHVQCHNTPRPLVVGESAPRPASAVEDEDFAIPEHRLVVLRFVAWLRLLLLRAFGLRLLWPHVVVWWERLLCM